MAILDWLNPPESKVMLLPDAQELWKSIVVAGTSNGKLFGSSPEENAKYLASLATELVKEYSTTFKDYLQ
ncbi:hypothetical protein CPT_Minot_086 [Acinetobacter phage Minot]|nr:hypothetical protein CPT_Minot_086 [Acinetobacter phage Minot]QQO96537.1 hypothetical protein CPT_Mokit_086 [Acinetobacter phage Mokit]QQO96792.1 hypothetical protein CPT_Melin_091 [Acinetobacter phage Melin]